MKASTLQICFSLAALTLLMPGPIHCGATDADKPVVGAATATATDKEKGAKPIADFEKGKPVTIADVPWMVFTDAGMGGKSTLQISIASGGAPGSRNFLRITGSLTSDFQWGGFAGTRAALQSDESPVNVGAYSGVRFYARGDGKKYRLLVGKANVKDGNHFGYEFTAPSEWTLIWVPFAQLAQSPLFGTQVSWSPENVTAVGFLARAEPGASSEVKLEIDNIGFYTQK